jgi:hypothetical protein
MKQSPRRVWVLGAMLAAALSTAPLLAHHGWSGYSDDEFEITGTVDTPLSLAGQHATMRIKVEGKVWDLTLASPSATQSAGLTEKTLPMGATVKVQGHRSKDPNRLEVKTERITFNNKVYAVYPNRT